MWGHLVLNHVQSFTWPCTCFSRWNRWSEKKYIYSSEKSLTTQQACCDFSIFDHTYMMYHAPEWSKRLILSLVLTQRYWLQSFVLRLLSILKSSPEERSLILQCRYRLNVAKDSFLFFSATVQIIRSLSIGNRGKKKVRV